MFRTNWATVPVLIAAVLLAGAVRAGDSADPDAAKKSAQAASEAAKRALVRGPATLTLRDQAKLALPEHFGFIPQKEAGELMRVMGNRTGDTFIGLIVPLGEDANGWLVSAQYEPSGYIKDDDAQHWDAAKLLETLKEGTEAANADREALGIPPITVTRWIEVPTYASQSHQLAWSAEARLKNGNDPDPTVNYNTYVLGREGYISLNLITSAANIEQEKPIARQLLAAVAFNDGKRYGDFKPSTDKVAAYGLGALVAGVAAKKLGLLALLAATVVKFAKVIALAVAGLGAAITRWVKGRTRGESAKP
jgi:uncharacterized membrane-anchored protein